MTEIIASALGFLTACVVSARYLAGYWIKSQKEVRLLEKKIFSDTVEALKKTLSDLKQEMSAELVRFKSEIALIAGKYKENQELSKKVMEGLELYTKQNEQRLKQIEGVIEEKLGKVILK